MRATSCTPAWASIEVSREETACWVDPTHVPAALRLPVLAIANRTSNADSSGIRALSAMLHAIPAQGHFVADTAMRHLLAASGRPSYIPVPAGTRTLTSLQRWAANSSPETSSAGPGFCHPRADLRQMVPRVPQNLVMECRTPHESPCNWPHPGQPRVVTPLRICHFLQATVVRPLNLAPTRTRRRPDPSRSGRDPPRSSRDRLHLMADPPPRYLNSKAAAGFIKWMSRINKWVFKATGGRVGSTWRLGSQVGQGCAAPGRTVDHDRTKDR